jgi:hypothetical protein
MKVNPKEILKLIQRFSARDQLKQGLQSQPLQSLSFKGDKIKSPDMVQQLHRF